ncbi:MAG: hypothetical protein CMJ83_12160 [Planctomycetes bacterium]|nr:hypothetical protein [Planctomycetota bacterium]
MHSPGYADLRIAGSRSIPADQQELLRLHHQDGLSIDEIASIFSERGAAVSSSDVNAMLRRARSTFRGVVCRRGILPPRR